MTMENLTRSIDILYCLTVYTSLSAEQIDGLVFRKALPPESRKIDPAAHFVDERDVSETQDEIRRTSLHFSRYGWA